MNIVVSYVMPFYARVTTLYPVICYQLIAQGLIIKEILETYCMRIEIGRASCRERVCQYV